MIHTSASILSIFLIFIFIALILNWFLNYCRLECRFYIEVVCGCCLFFSLTSLSDCSGFFMPFSLTLLPLVLSALAPHLPPV